MAHSPGPIGQRLGAIALASTNKRAEGRPKMSSALSIGTCPPQRPIMMVDDGLQIKSVLIATPTQELPPTAKESYNNHAMFSVWIKVG